LEFIKPPDSGAKRILPMKVEEVNNVLVIGAGTMGEGIAQVFAQAALRVLLVDIDGEGLQRCRSQIETNLIMLKKFGLFPGDPKNILSRIEPRPMKEMSQIGKLLNGVDFVVEAVPEVLEIKRRLFGFLDEYPGDIVLSSNTSSLTISELSKDLKRPERVVGLHFLYPAHIIPLVEIHSGPKTSSQAISITKNLMKRTGKKPIVLKKEISGFIVNRIQAAYNREVTYLIDQGVATVEDLDTAAKAGFGFRLACLGPLEIHDLNGLDVVMRAGGKTRQSICNDRGHSQSLTNKVKNGELGVKTGKGWHDYQGRTREEIKNESNAKLLRQLALFQTLNFS